MGIIGWIVLGLIVGVIARILVKDNMRGGWLATLLLGVVGALIGGWLGSVLFNIGLEDFWSLQTWLVAIVGAVVVLWVYSITIGKGARR